MFKLTECFFSKNFGITNRSELVFSLEVCWCWEPLTTCTAVGYHSQQRPLMVLVNSVAEWHAAIFDSIQALPPLQHLQQDSEKTSWSGTTDANRRETLQKMASPRTITIVALSFALGLFFVFMGTIKLTPRLSKDAYSEMVSDRRLAAPVIIIKWSFSWTLTALF